MIKVSDKLYRGPRPKSHKELQEAGIVSVINLQSGAYEEFHDDKYEFELPSDFSIVEYDIHCSDVMPPRPVQIAKFLEVIEKSPGPVYVHCLHGKDRTGFMCAAYRVLVQKWSYKDAIVEMDSLGFHRWSYNWWKLFLRKYLAQF